jgi:hypothetical protein
MNMNTMIQAYRTTCIPKNNRLDALIPNEYIGQEIEIIIMPVFGYTQPKYNAETEAAMQEVRDIRAGKIKVKSYATVAEMNADLDAEDDD